jgi:uncharacterized protein YyaL (SSP411 family)
MPNRLAQSPSLYLRKHAENPIDWWPWSAEALAAAQAQNKPIFLSIGYSSCHWCTVMEGEAFSDLEIAAYLNANFLPIKVDREERPDIDSIYMQALQLMTGQGGWPLNLFLHPGNRQPFYGGTYFPVQSRFNRPGFLQVLQSLRHYYDTESEQLAQRQAQLMDYLHQSDPFQPLTLLTPALLQQGIQKNTAVIMDPSPAPCFPMMPYAQLTLLGAGLGGAHPALNALEACHVRGVNLSLGGIYDQVAGGFHRYAVDATWTVPHFEKMLYDNGQIVEYLANLWRFGAKEPAFARAITGTIAWLTREMTAPAGYFYAAQDADNFAQASDPEPEEGQFYVWGYPELEQNFSAAEILLLEETFYLGREGNFEANTTVLQRRQTGELGTAVQDILAKLFQIRYGQLPNQLSQFPPARDNHAAKTQSWPGRIPPVTDTKMIVAWNSLMISGLAAAAIAMYQADYFQLAQRAAEVMLQQQWPTQTTPSLTATCLQRLNYDGQAQVDAQSEDYAFLIKACLDLQQASSLFPEQTTTTHWLSAACRLQAEFDQRLWAESGGYYNTAPSPDLILKERSWMDHATPSANGIAFTNLVRLFLFTEETHYLERAEQGLQAFAGVMESTPTGCPSLFAALATYQHPLKVRVAPAYVQTLIAEQYHPTAVFIVDQELPNGAVGLVCKGLSCLAPAMSLTDLQAQLRLERESS